jgi:RNA polymerase sigma-70 factor (ECF subfamily)
MDAFAAGDDAAFTTVDTLGRAPLTASLRRLTRDATTAAELAQDTLVRVLRSRHHWRPGARFLPWPSAIGRRLFLERLRRERTCRRAYDALAHREAQRTAGTPAEAVVAARLVADVARAVTALPPAQRDVVERVVLAGEPLTAAARRLGCAPVAVRVRLCRARRALAAILASGRCRRWWRCC